MAAVDQCRKDGFRVAATVVDRAGRTKVVVRDDGTGPHTVEASQRKAYTAAIFRVPTAAFAERVKQPAAAALINLEHVIALQGGVPIKAEDEVRRAETILLPALDSWRTRGASDLVPTGPALGSFDWLVTEFKKSPKFSAKLSLRTKRDHDWLLELASSIKLRDGRRFGEVQIAKINEAVVDKLYARLRYVVERGDDGVERTRDRLTTANHAMASAQRAWNVVRRSNPDRVPVVNPFAKMERESSDRTTRAATFDQLQAFVAACDSAGHPSIATAALILWHWCVREEHLVGQVIDAKGTIRALPWSSYRPADDPDSILLIHWKNDEVVVMPLADEDRSPLFPQLTDRLDASPRQGPFIIMRDHPDRATGVHLPWVTPSGDLTHFRHTVRKIMNKAALPSEITFTSFRHGGVTEAADADLTDRQMRALSGHRTADVLDIYAKRTRVQRIVAVRKRNAYRTK